MVLVSIIALIPLTVNKDEDTRWTTTPGRGIFPMHVVLSRIVLCELLERVDSLEYTTRIHRVQQQQQQLQKQQLVFLMVNSHIFQPVLRALLALNSMISASAVIARLLFVMSYHYETLLHINSRTRVVSISVV